MKIWIVGGKASPGYFQPDDETEVWGLNAVRHKWINDARWNRMFNLHMFAHLARDWPQGLEKEKDWAKNHPDVPFYVLDPWPSWLSNQIIFPRDILSAMPRGDYHAGSFDWMVAFAVARFAVEEITIQGVSLMQDAEPISARPCLEYWLGYAEGRGIKVTTTPDCALFSQYHLVKSNSIYGYDDIQLVEDRTGSGYKPPCG